MFLSGYVLIAAEHLTKINKAAVAMLLAVIGWIVIGNDDFDTYMPFIANISLFMLATISIVEVLNENGCFDFLVTWMRRRSKWRMVVVISAFTFFLSANLDNLITTVMMLHVMHKLIDNSKQRMLVGAIIVICANCGGCFSVIGDYTSLMLWTKNAVTPTGYTLSLMLPLFVSAAMPVILIARRLPEHLVLVQYRTMFRGNDELLPLWQRVLMFIVGLGGLWFIPTFRRLTELPPFVGAFCVLAVFWVLNEIINYKRTKNDMPQQRLLPRSIQFESYQVIMYFIGIALAVAVLVETGVLAIAARWLDDSIHNVYLVSIILGMLSGVMDNITLVMSAVSMYPVIDSVSDNSSYLYGFVEDGTYWHLVAFSAGVGSCLLPIGSTAGLALMKSDDVTVWWWLKTILPKVMCGWLAGLLLYFLINN